jgi:polyferredoxin
VRRTRPALLLIVAVLGVAVGFVLDQALTAAGRATFTPAVSLPILLVLLAVIVVALAVPVRRATQGTAAPVNPFRALRIAVLAKASSIVGAVTMGIAAGLALFLLTRPVPPSLGSLGAIIATALCAALLVAAGLVAEQFCTIRKDDDDEQPGGPDPGLQPHEN